MRYLTHSKKEKLRSWINEHRAEIDPDILPWCFRLNDLEGVCTFQSCQGHLITTPAYQAPHRKTPDEEFWYQAYLYLWLSGSMMKRFDKAVYVLVEQRNVSIVRRVYSVKWQQYGEAIDLVEIRFHGAERNKLDRSMAAIFDFFKGLSKGFQKLGGRSE